MNWQDFWNQQARNHSNPHAQVGRVRAGKTLSEEMLGQIAEHIQSNLKLQKEDILLDVCCGNGFLTRKLAAHCQYTLGLDLSAEQLALAQQAGTIPGLEYGQADATQLDDFFVINYQSLTFSKINLYFSFQYLDSYAKGKKAIEGMLNRLKPGGLIFIGDVPDQEYFSTFYPSLKERLLYPIKAFLGNNDMGKFWSEKEMKQIGKTLGARVKRIQQPDHLPYASYRSDYLIYR